MKIEVFTKKAFDKLELFDKFRLDLEFYQSESFCDRYNVQGFETYVAYNENNEKPFFSFLYRKTFLGFLNIWWIPDRPLGYLSSLSELLKKINVISNGIFYVRLSSKKVFNPEERFSYIGASFLPAFGKLQTGWTLGLNLNSFEIDKNINRTWKRSLYLSNDKDYNISYDVRLEDIVSSYASLRSKKTDITLYSESELTAIFNGNSHRLISVKVTSGQNIVACRSAIVAGDNAVDIFAASDPNFIGASHLCLRKLLEVCIAKNIKFYDFGGIDLIKSKGVYNFKKGLNGKPIFFTGEFYFASHKILNFMFIISQFRKIKLIY